jgi:hypothetical protein
MKQKIHEILCAFYRVEITIDVAVDKIAALK